MRVTIGFEVGTGARVELEINHTVITGITGSGKTTLAQRIINQVDKALVFDIKNDYTDIPTYPPSISSKLSDPLTLKEILEVYSGMSLRGEFPELIKVAADSESISQIIQNLQKLIESSSIHPLRKDKLLVINEILKKFFRELRPIIAMRRFKNPNKIRIDLSSLSYPMQQFIVAEEIRKIDPNVKVFIDEAHRYIPQAQSSISRRSIVNLLREGRSKGNFAFLIDQTITGILKEALKQCWNWIIGRQLEFNEVKRVTKQVLGVNLSPEEIASLRVGEFLFFRPGEVYRFYAWPIFMEDREAREIAIEMGEETNHPRLHMRPNPQKTKEHLIIELIKALDKFTKSISLIIEQVSQEKTADNYFDEKTLILEAIDRRPGITLHELKREADSLGLSQRELSRAIKWLIDSRLIEIESYGDDIKLYPNRTRGFDEIDDIDLT